MNHPRGRALARRQLRVGLRNAREKANLTQQAVAAHLDWSLSKIHRLEGGLSPIDTSDLRAMLALYESESHDIDRLVDLAREARQRADIDAYADILPKPFAEWVELEAYASKIIWYEPTLVPGAFQTEDYAKPILRAYLRRPTDVLVHRRSKGRVCRGDHLARGDGPDISIILEEAVIRRGVGNSGTGPAFAVMIDQLNRLKRLNTVGRAALGDEIPDDLNPRISIQVVPYALGAHSAMRGSFELLSFESEMPERLVYLEGPNEDAVIVDSLHDTTWYSDNFLDLSQRIPHPSQTNGIIDSVIAAMRNGSNGVSSDAMNARSSTQTAEKR